MDVDLKYGNLHKRVCNINLHEGCRPRVGTDSGKTPPESQMLEPAIWFKCLLITYIHVDCDQRRVRFRKISALSTVSDSETWQPDRHTNSSSQTNGELLTLRTATMREDFNDYRLGNLSTDSVYEVYDDGECYDFDSLIDEFFNQASENLIDFSQGILNESDFNICVLKLLHCFILPSVKFVVSDLPILLMAQDYINCQVAKAEEQILKQDKMVFFTESSLKSQRERLFRTENFLKESNVRNCKTEFLSILLKDVEKDILKIDRLLDDYQEKINHVKIDSGDEAEPLVNLRKERDTIHQQLANLEHIRENIKNVIIRPVAKKKRKFKKKKLQNVFHDIYVEVSKKLNEQKETLQNMCFKKVKIVTVREAIILSIRDVQTVGETVGIEVKIDGSERATDIFDVKLKPDSWKTHEEKVALILSNPKQEACRIHKIFCNRIRDRIKAAIEEYVLFRTETLKNGACMEVKISNTEMELLNQSGLSSHHARYPLPFDRDSFHASLSNRYSDSMELPVIRNRGADESFHLDQRMSDVSIDDHLHTLPLKSSIDTFRSDIHTHIQNICKNVLPSAFEHSEITFSKLWLIYENHLYHNLMNDIIELYSVAYESVCNNLLNNISKFSISEFVNEGSFSQRFLLGQDLSTFSAPVDSLENSDDETEEIVNGKIRLSMSMDEMKWESDLVKDLYRSADEDCSSLMESIKLSFGTRRNSMKTQSSSDSVESFHDAMAQNSIAVEPSDVQMENMSSQKKDEYDLTNFKQTFSPALICLDNMLVTSSIVGKLRCLTRIFRFLGTTISTLCSSENSDYLACSDDILTTTILLLVLLVDHQKLKQFYVQLMTMVDLMAPCLIGGIHDCSLTNFYSAFHFIFSHIVLMSRRS